MFKSSRKKGDDDPDYEDPGQSESQVRSHKRKSSRDDIYLPRTGWKKWTVVNLPDLVRDAEKLSRWLEETGVKHPVKSCPKCGNGMDFDNDSGSWRCRAKVTLNKQQPEECDTEITGMKTLFFGGSRLPRDKMVLLTHGLVHNRSTGELMRDLNIDYAAVVNWRSYVRQVMLDWALNNQDQIGGPGRTVEIDESKFGKRKYHRGPAVEGQWVFGGIERESSSMFLVAVEARGRETLLPIIKKHVKPGTTITSDCWKSKGELDENDLKHLNISHRDWFLEPFIGVHRSTVEGRWRQVKGFMRQYSRKKGHNAGYLAQYMFYKYCFVEQKDPLEFFLGLTPYCEFTGFIDEDSDPEIYEDEEEYIGQDR